MMNGVIKLLFILVAGFAPIFGDPNFKNTFKQATKEVQNELLTNITGIVPRWLSGDFVRQICASYGDVDGVTDGYISHMFDCIPMIGLYNIDNGKVKYSNKFFDSRNTRIWKHYGMNISRSKVSWPTAFADINIDAFKKEASKSFNETLLFNPSVNFWKSREQDPILAVTESFYSPTAVKISPDLDIIGMYMGRFHDKGFPSSFHPGSGYRIINNPSHEQADPDGTVWSSTLEIEQFSKAKQDNLEIAVVVYSIKGNNRTLASRHVLGKYNLSSCSSLKQADLDIMPGYTHFIQTTSKHVIVPQTSYRFDYCLDYKNRDKIVPGFLRSYAWHPTVNSSVLVFERENMTNVHHVYLPYAKFFTHDVNAYEDATHMYLDMFAYRNADIYLIFPQVKNILNDLSWSASAIRVAIDKRGWSYDATKSAPLTETDPFGKLDYPSINYERYHQRSYSFIYFIANSHNRGAKIAKLNIFTRKMIFWTPPFGYYPQEPIFVPSVLAQSEWGNDEDNGIILCSGPISNPPGTSFLAILNAKDLSQVALIKNPNAAPFGQHNRFYKKKDSKRSASSSASACFSIFFLFFTVQLAFK